MKRSHVFAVIGAVALAVPMFAAAQSANTVAGTNVRDLNGFFRLIASILNTLIGLCVTLGVLVFIWGLVKYLWTVGESKSEGLQTMLWGTLAIFFMVSFWGVIRILQNTLGVNNNPLGMQASGPDIYGGSTIYNQSPTAGSQGR